MHWLDVIGRLKPGVSLDQARADLDRIAGHIAQADPEWHGEAGLTLVPLREVMVGATRPALLALMGAVGFVMLVVCLLLRLGEVIFESSTPQAKIGGHAGDMPLEIGFRRLQFCRQIGRHLRLGLGGLVGQLLQCLHEFELESGCELGILQNKC